MSQRNSRWFIEMEEDHEHKETEVENDQTESSCSSSSLKYSYSVNSQNEYEFSLRSIAKAGKPLNFVEQMKLKFELLKDNGDFKDSGKFTYLRPFSEDNVPSEDEVDDINYDREDSGKNIDKIFSTLKGVKLRARSLSNIREMSQETPELHDGGYKDRYSTIDPPSKNHSRPVQPRKNPKYSHVQSFLSNERFTRVFPPDEVHEARNSQIVVQPAMPETFEAQYSDSFDSDFDPDDAMQPEEIVEKPKEEEEEHEIPKLVVSNSQDNLPSEPVIDGEEPTEQPSVVSRVLQELIETERKYVIALKQGIDNYYPMFDDYYIPVGLRGKKYVLFGNIEEILEFHEEDLLPMFEENKDDICKLCEGFCGFIERGDFYAYVLYTINKVKSEKLCLENKTYLQAVENSVSDKLGINSFLVQPVQRLPRYKLLLDEMISSHYTADANKHKAILAACCRTHKYISDLLTTVNESVKLNDIEECYSINLLYQGRFLKCDEFYVYDYTQKRAYKSLVFIFEKALVYTELVRDKVPTYRGFYPCEKIGFHTKKKSFELYLDKLGNQQCSFSADPPIMETWYKLITDMINTFVQREKRRLKAKYTKQVGYQTLRPKHSFVSNRSSADSGMSVSTSNLSYRESFESSPRTTWYCESPGAD